MKLAAALILALASSVALASPPISPIPILGNLQPISGFVTRTGPHHDGLAVSGFHGDAADADVDGADFLLWQRSGAEPGVYGYEPDAVMDGNDRDRSPNGINEWLPDGDRIRRD